jgi:hypothetical protein
MKEKISLNSKLIDSLILFIGGLPAFWVIGIVLFAIRARIHLGYWPAPNHPDPQVLPFASHDFLLFYSIYVVLGSMLVLPCLKMLLSSRVNPNTWHRTRLIFLSGWALILILTVVPEIDFIAWYLD